mmetsp:Transcript_4100/g.9177  ORF Transcript_4100/g.9177 Transcript_4100/m.9177 type:complete len:280 (-) Transcript_4100:1344-2183(-)
MAVGRGRHHVGGSAEDEDQQAHPDRAGRDAWHRVSYHRHPNDDQEGASEGLAGNRGRALLSRLSSGIQPRGNAIARARRPHARRPGAAGRVVGRLRASALHVHSRPNLLRAGWLWHVCIHGARTQVQDWLHRGADVADVPHVPPLDFPFADQHHRHVPPEQLRPELPLQRPVRRRISRRLLRVRALGGRLLGIPLRHHLRLHVRAAVVASVHVLVVPLVLHVVLLGVLLDALRAPILLLAHDRHPWTDQAHLGRHRLRSGPELLRGRRLVHRMVRRSHV